VEKEEKKKNGPEKPGNLKNFIKKGKEGGGQN